MVNTRRRSARHDHQDHKHSIPSAPTSQHEHKPSIPHSQHAHPPVQLPTPTTTPLPVPPHVLARLSPLFPTHDLTTPTPALLLACYERLASAEEWRSKADRLFVEFESAVFEKDREVVELERERDGLVERAERAELEKAEVVREKEELLRRVGQVKTVEPPPLKASVERDV